MKRRKKRKRFSRIAADDFREVRILSALSQVAVADLLFVDVRTVRNWEKGLVRVPYAAYKLLRILGRYELPHSSWEGWCVVGDALWSPDGRAFRSDDLFYLRWMFAMARAWRDQYTMRQRDYAQSPADTPLLAVVHLLDRGAAQAGAPGDPPQAGSSALPREPLSADLQRFGIPKRA